MWGPTPFSNFFLSFLACLDLRAMKEKVDCPPGTTFSVVQITPLSKKFTLTYMIKMTSSRDLDSPHLKFIHSLTFI
jgi:hypothetical protein